MQGKCLVQTTRHTLWVLLDSLPAVPYRIYVDSLPQASVSGIHVCCVCQSQEDFLLPSCSRTLCDSTSGLSTVNIFFWLCTDAFIKRLTATTHSAFLFKFLLIHLFYFFHRDDFSCAVSLYVHFEKKKKKGSQHWVDKPRLPSVYAPGTGILAFTQHWF